MIPAHCTACLRFSDCRQKEFMGANTQPEDAYAVEDAAGDLVDFACKRCAAPGAKHLYSVGDVDHPVHCDCGAPLRCTLTREGQRYIKKNSEGCTRELWPALFP